MRFTHGPAAALVAMAISGPVAAHETDQFTVPLGKDFADVGPELTAMYYDGIDAAVTTLNERIRRALEARRGPGYIAFLQDPETLTDTVYDKYAAAWFMINRFEHMVHSDRAMRLKHPGRIVGYWESIDNIFTGVYFPLDPRQLFRIFHACTMKAYGFYLGPDKLGHFTDMGYVYYTIHRAARAGGDTPARAHEKVMAEGMKGLILGEEGMLGYLSSGVYSNADLAANYAGMKFFRNLTRPVRIKGVQRPPMTVLRGDFWEISPHVRRDTDLFAWFISEHWNEAINPGLFVPGMRAGVRRGVKSRTQRILDFYVDDNGNRRTREYFDARLEELSTWYGEDYGHQGSPEELITIGNTCFEAPPDAGTGERNDIGYTLLHWGAATDDRALVLNALDGGAPVDEPVRSLEPSSTEWGSTPLHLAATAGHEAMVGLLLERGAEVNQSNERGATALHRAVEHAGAVALLIRAGADLNASDERGRTPLHWAARYTLNDSMRLLLAGGAAVGATDHAGETALHRAALRGQLRVMQVLLAAGADVNARAHFETTPLHFAVRRLDPAPALLLAEHGAILDAPDEFGITPLHDAARNGSLRMARALIGAGADAGAADCHGSTPLHVAARYGHEAVAAALLDEGVEVNVPNRFGSLPLHEAVFASPTSLINLLMACGAEPTARNLKGESSIDLAESGGHSVAVLIMKSTGWRKSSTSNGVQ